MSRKNIPVVVLCGGKGTRLGTLSQSVPKPLVPVGGMPILWHIMKLYAHHGFKDFVLCLGHKGELFEEYFESGTISGMPFGLVPPREPDWNVRLVDTGEETGTSGRLARVKHLLEEERCCVTYGDGFSDVAISDLVVYHETKGKLATVTAVHPPTSFGIIRQEDGVVVSFEEKPRLDVLINGGFFVLEREALDYLEEDGPFEVTPLRRLTEDRQLAVYRHGGFWKCLDTPKEMNELNSLWESGERPWAVWERGAP